VLNDKIIPMSKEWYSTTAFTDHAMQFIDEGVKANQPVFLYIAYTAPHWALHAPDDEIAKFRGRYARGWQPVREARFQRQMKMGMFPSHTKLSKQDQSVPAWPKVKDPEEMDLRMATHAAMVHLVDRGVGRIVSKLKALEQLDNTLILFLSDNGASAESGPTGFTGARGGDPKARTGTPDSYNSFGTAGANMCDTPFRKYKMFVHEGGIATPLIAHWPKGIPAKLNGRLTPEVGHVIDLLPTCADVAGATYPQEFEGRAVTPVAGRSLKPVLTGKSVKRPEGLYFEHQGNAAVRIGNWKLVRAHRKPWAIYNLEADRTELADVSKQHPGRTLEMKAKWQAWAERVGVQSWPIKKK
jgi:arylsulfatase